MARREMILLLIVISLFSVFANADDNCGYDKRCSPNCANGDADCYCQQENGFLCGANEECLGNILKSWDEGICCSRNCSDSVLIGNASSIKSLVSNELDKTEEIIGSTRVGLPSDEKSSQYPIALVAVALAMLALFIAFTLHHFGEDK